MTQIQANGIAIEYESYGKDTDPPLLLIMGLGAQLTYWPMELVEALAGRGFRVIRYDNRDIGLSEKFTHTGTPSIPVTAIMTKLGLRKKLPYQLADMADDAAALLDALDIPAAHIVGASMGGMIAQHVAMRHPTKVLSLTSIMSTTGNPKLPAARKDAIKALTQRPKDTDKATITELGLTIARAIGSPDFPRDEERLREFAGSNYDRSFHPTGMPRQLAAIIADGDRRKRLQAVKAPTLVIHGEADPLVPVEGGHDTAEAIPGAKLHTIPGMGHDLPLELVDEMADAIAGHAKAA
ncbi:Prolyl aminopeptidase [Alteripontixanthobacter maritimus]|uniref:Prolyl aminopeptidase n=1 Tax=Alteripontixanthobacter maritimus TaxID=2161824 RepID=A0A369Q6P4_9SPHN|nr:alpha/beta hydrolase [Alteripontixanthobacter maritimus]RDC58987.1 Prolyl aminopeptidase [Alteripontixanthobacter maritimus]